MGEYERLSGSTERRMVLLASNIILMILGLCLACIAVFFFASLHFNHLDYASVLFSATPAVILVAGLLIIGVASYGLFLWHRKREISQGFRYFALVLVVSALTCIIASILAFLLRETIAHTFVTTSVQDQLERYNEDETVKTRWDVLQSAYKCCGGGPRGHRDWTNREGRLIEVPESCCMEKIAGCGRDPFVSERAIPPVEQVIFTNGCIRTIKSHLHEIALPLLLAVALVALVAGLIQVLMILLACCFADHVRKIKDIKRSSLSLERGTPAPIYGGSTVSRQNGGQSTTPHGAIQVQTLESSPSLKSHNLRSPIYYNIGGATSPSPSSRLDHIPELEGESLEGGSGRSRHSISAVSNKSFLSNSNNETSKLTAERERKSSVLSWFGWKKYNVNATGEIPESRKEKLRSDALDREQTLMSVLKSVTLERKKDEEHEAGTGVKEEVDGGKPAAKRGFSAIFAKKSKSKEDVLARPKIEEKIVKNRAKSMDTIDPNKAEQKTWKSWLSKSKEWLHIGGSADSVDKDLEKNIEEEDEADKAKSDADLEQGEETNNKPKTEAISEVSQSAPSLTNVDNEQHPDSPVNKEGDWKTESVDALQAMKSEMEELEQDSNGTKRLKTPIWARPKKSEDDKSDEEGEEREKEVTEEKVERSSPLQLTMEDADAIRVVETEEDDGDDKEVAIKGHLWSVPRGYKAPNVDVIDSQTLKLKKDSKTSSEYDPTYAPIKPPRNPTGDKFDLVTPAVGHDEQHRDQEPFRKSEGDLRTLSRKARKSLPSRKPTVIGSSEDILAHSATKSENNRVSSPTTAGNFKVIHYAPKLSSVSSPTSLPYHRTVSPSNMPTPYGGGSRPKRASVPEMPSGAARTKSPRRHSSRQNMSPSNRHIAEEIDDFSRQIRISGFGVDKLRPKMKAMMNKADDEKRVPKSREIRPEDEERIAEIEKEILNSSSRKTSKYIQAEIEDDEARELEEMILSGIAADEKHVPVGHHHSQKRKKSPRAFSPVEHEEMLRRRRKSDRAFLEFMEQSKWKDDKVIKRPATRDSAGGTTASDESDHQAYMRRSNSDSSLSSGGGGGGRESRGSYRKLSRPQFFINREDGSIVAAFESVSPTRTATTANNVRGKSHESLRLPFGKTENYSSLEPIELSFVEQADNVRYSGRAKSEPRIASKKKASTAGTQTIATSSSRLTQMPPRSKSSDRFALSSQHRHSRPTTASSGRTSRVSNPRDAWDMLHDLREQEDRHLYRTTVEVNSPSQRPETVRRSSTIFAPGERPSTATPVPPPRQRHFSVTTLNVNGSRV